MCSTIREDLEGCENKEFENNSIKKCFFDQKLQIRYQCFAFVEMKEAKPIKTPFLIQRVHLLA
jgi:hypothetical protein